MALALRERTREETDKRSNKQRVMGWLCTELQFGEADRGSFLESGVPALISKT